MRKVSKLMTRIGAMSRPARIIVVMCLIISNVCVAAALILLLYAGGLTPYTYRLYTIAGELFAMPQALLLIASIGSVCIEDAVTR